MAPYNDALPFIEFVSAHKIGSVVEGEVERFASHGAYVLVDGTRCYLPLKHLADPPPRSAREVLSFGQPYSFVVHAFDTPRRGVDLTMPGVVPVGTASDPVHQLTEEARVAPAKKKAAAKKAPARKKAAAKKAPARKKAAAKRAPARKAAKRR
jgi:ribosomal protein S1